MKSLHNWKQIGQPLIGVVGLLGIWQLAVLSGWIDPFLLPSVGETVKAVIAGFTTGPLWGDLGGTLNRTGTSFALACVVAVPLGVMLGASRELYRSLEFVIDFFRSTPGTALFPLFMVLFGAGDMTKVAAATFGAGLVILFNSAYGVMNARKTRILAGKVMGVGRVRLLFDIMLREAIPQIIVGMRSGVSIALIIIIVSEMLIGSTDGLGYRIYSAQMLFDMPTMYGVIFITGAVGYGFNLLFLILDGRFVHWGGK